MPTRRASCWPIPTWCPGGRIWTISVRSTKRACSCTSRGRRAVGSTSAAKASCKAPTRPLPPPGASITAARWQAGGFLAPGWGAWGARTPLAASFAGAASLTIECRQSSIDARLRTGYLDRQARDIDHAIECLRQHLAAQEAVSIALLGNAAELLPELLRRAQAGGLKPDLVTDQTSAHDLVNGYLPGGWTLAQWHAAQQDAGRHAQLRQAAARSCAVHVQAMLDFQAMGIPVVDYGNNIRQVAFDEGVKNAFDIPGFVPAYIRPLFCAGKGPFRW